MSDYISDIDNCVQFYNRIYEQHSFNQHEGFSNTSDVNRLKANFGIERDVYSQRFGQRRCNQDSNFFEQDCYQKDKNNLIESMDVSDFRQLERLSANLIQLLNEARQNSAKLKSKCGNTSRPVYSHGRAPNRQRCCPHCVAANEHVSVKIGKDHQQNIQTHNAEPIMGQINYMPERVTCTPQVPSTNVSLCGTLIPENTPAMTGLTGTGFNDTSSISSLDESEKDRKKKNNKHSKMERKKRSIVTNRMAEIEGLVPANAKRSSCMQKRPFLKESADYNKSFQTDQDQVKILQDKVDDTGRELRHLIQRIERLETKVSTRFSHKRMFDRQFGEANDIHSSSLPPDEPDRNLQQHHSNTIVTVPQILPLHDSYDVISAPISVDSLTSVPSTCSSGMDISDMNCYL
ncbi:uncharacterized protein LOC132726479 [Ruditapes philippinarum]|uniref:uncharacterized protein LOC132726479 n=1 Tax=Ruditapes philippinarum TaxID=129788 RepID=UPI00295AEAED|nr:uncharacterized protein LOC132726479 [Ruditapes philippinarum]